MRILCSIIWVKLPLDAFRRMLCICLCILVQVLDAQEAPNPNTLYETHLQQSPSSEETLFTTPGWHPNKPSWLPHEVRVTDSAGPLSPQSYLWQGWRGQALSLTFHDTKLADLVTGLTDYNAFAPFSHANMQLYYGSRALAQSSHDTFWARSPLRIHYFSGEQNTHGLSLDTIYRGQEFNTQFFAAAAVTNGDYLYHHDKPRLFNNDRHRHFIHIEHTHPLNPVPFTASFTSWSHRGGWPSPPGLSASRWRMAEEGFIFHAHTDFKTLFLRRTPTHLSSLQGRVGYHLIQKQHTFSDQYSFLRNDRTIQHVAYIQSVLPLTRLWDTSVLISNHTQLQCSIHNIASFDYQSFACHMPLQHTFYWDRWSLEFDWRPQYQKTNDLPRIQHLFAAYHTPPLTHSWIHPWELILTQHVSNAQFSMGTRYHQREPSIDELYATLGWWFGNPQLRTESGMDIFGKLDLKVHHAFILKLSAYMGYARDFIAPLALSAYITSPQNLPLIHRQGMTLHLELYPISTIKTELTSTISHHVFAKTLTQVPLIPPSHTQFSITWQPYSWIQIHWLSTLTQQTFASLYQTHRIPGYILHNLHIGVRVSSSLSLGLHVRNVFDTLPLYDLFQLPLPGRTLTFMGTLQI
jgi:hypothetical protein